MTATTELSAPKRRTRAQVQQLVSEFVSSRMHRVSLSESAFKLQHAGSPSEEAVLEEKAWPSFFGGSNGKGGVGDQEIFHTPRGDLWAGRSAAGRAPDRGTS